MELEGKILQINMLSGRSQWPRCLRHELSSFVPTLGSGLEFHLRHANMCAFDHKSHMTWPAIETGPLRWWISKDEGSGLAMLRLILTTKGSTSSHSRWDRQNASSKEFNFLLRNSPLQSTQPWEGYGSNFDLTEPVSEASGQTCLSSASNNLQNRIYQCFHYLCCVHTIRTHCFHLYTNQINATQVLE
jgi:hypothetical protein